MTAAPIPLLAPVTMKTLGDAIFARCCHGPGRFEWGEVARCGDFFLIAIAGGSGNVETVVSSVAGGYYKPVLAQTCGEVW